MHRVSKYAEKMQKNQEADVDVNEGTDVAMGGSISSTVKQQI